MEYTQACRLFCAALSLLLLRTVTGTFPNTAQLRKLAEIDTTQEILASRDKLASYLQDNLVSKPVGILIAAGGPVLLRNAAALVGLIRGHFHCELPIEVLHNGPQELYEPAVDVLLSYDDVKCIDATTFVPPVHHRSRPSIEGYVFKIYALYVSSFDKVLMMDPDNMPLLSPQVLVEDPGWAGAGNQFWPDFFAREGWTVVAPRAYEMFGLTPPWKDNPAYVTTESGQVLLDRRRHQDVLEWLWYIQTFAETFNGFMHGDKDMFRLAFSLANKSDEFNQVSFPTRSVIHEDSKDQTWNQFAMLQSLNDGTLAFLHRSTTGPKDGDASERNPLKRFWPTYITTPITGDLSPKLIDWDFDRNMIKFAKDKFDKHDFQCVLQRRSMHTRCPHKKSDKPGKTKVIEERGLKAVMDTLKEYQRLYGEILLHDQAPAPSQ